MRGWVDRLLQMLSGYSARSKEKMRSYSVPSCLVDFWVEETMKEISVVEGSSRPPPEFAEDVMISGCLFVFPFTAHDESTLSLLWVIPLLESHLEVLAGFKRRFPTSGAGIQSNDHSGAAEGDELLRGGCEGVTNPHFF